MEALPNMTGAITVNFDYNNAPALHPDVVVARIKKLYEKTLWGRDLLGFEKVDGEAISYITESEIKGGVDFIGEEGGIPKIEFEYGKKSKVIRPYGSYFDVTEAEVQHARYNMTKRKISRSVRQIREFEDALIYNDILNADDLLTKDGSNWTDPATGNPLSDFEAARTLIKDATKGTKPDTLVMSDATFEYLTSFDVIRNRLYLAGNYVATGTIPAISGMQIVVDDAVSPNGETQVLALKKKEIGYMAQTLDLQTPHVAGLMMSNPLINQRYFVYTQAEPVIDNAEMGCLISVGA